MSKNNLPVAEARVNLTQDLDWTDVSGESEIASGRSVVAGIAAAPGVVGEHALYVPLLTGHNMVIICPKAVQLSEVSENCEDSKKYVEADSNVSIVSIDDKKYWRVDGLTGTGGISGVDESLASSKPNQLINTGSNIIVGLYYGSIIIL